MVVTRRSQTRQGVNGSVDSAHGATPSQTKSDGLTKNRDHKKKLCGWSAELLAFQDLPSFLRDNEFLLHSHRPELSSFKECGKSIFRLHTETCNIWTHIIGCFMFTCIMLYHVSLPTHECPWSHKLYFSVFYLGAIVCLGMSSLYHTCTCHSREVAKLFSKLDYCGVIALILSSAVPWIYYGFYCQDTLKLFYISLLLFFGTISIIIVLQDKFGTPKYRPLRAALFIAMGLTGVFPGVHFFILEGFFQTLPFTGWLILMAVTYIGGGLIYAARVPERLWPGCFDIWGHSHQILHICVVTAALLCFYGLHKMTLIRLDGTFSCQYIP